MTTHPDTQAAVADGYRPLPWLDTLLVVCVLTLTIAFPQLRSSGMFNIQASTVVDSTSGSALMQMVYGGSFLLAGYVFWHNQRLVLRSIRQGGFMLPAMLLLLAASTLWSGYPEVTFKRAIQLAGLFLIGALAALPGIRSAMLCTILRRALTTMLALSMLMALALPQYGVDVALDQAWQGIFWQKNTLGAACAFCALVWLHTGCEGLCRPRTWMAGLLFSVFMLVMSKSSTSLLVLVIAIGLYVAIRYLGVLQQAISAIALLVLAVGVALGVHLFYTYTGHLPTWQDITSPLTAIVGKGSDLTGRTDIWRMLQLSIAQHPWLGTGYGAFWIGEGGPAQYIADQIYWMPSQGHNGYLDLINETGFVGLAMLALLMLMHLHRLVRLARYDRGTAALHIGFLAMIAISNFSETYLFAGVAFQTCLFIYSCLIVANTLAEHRLQAARAARAPRAAMLSPRHDALA